MDAVVNKILDKWQKKHIEYGSEEFMEFLTDINLLIEKKKRLKPVYHENQELYHYMTKSIRSLDNVVYFPRRTMKVKEEAPELIEYKPENFLSERQKRIKAQMEKDAEKKKQQNLF